MKYCNLFLILFLVHLFSCQKNQVTKIDLTHLEWSLRSSDSSIVLKKVDPSDVHLALINAGIIRDPFYRNHEKELQWIGKKNWFFESAFDIDSSLLNYDNLELVFEGLDTYAEVLLNDSLVLSADNMFRRWRLEVGDLIKKENNRLQVKFTSPLIRNKDKQYKLSYKLPDDRGFTRKAAYQYGWDWGPAFVTTGIWKPAYLNAWSSALIRDVHQSSLKLSENEAMIIIETEIEVTDEGFYMIQVFINDTLNSELNAHLHVGVNTYNIPVNIKKPKLWWPNGYGDHYRYLVTTKLLDENKLIDEFSYKTGIRKVELIQEPDSIGRSFYFKINGVPIFIKGANYIPQDNFLSRLKEEDYKRLIVDAKNSNMNMLRVWGGGIYENNIFYDLCDEYGIMVWQDFMFACNLYPGDSLFMENVKKEAIDNIQRIQSHPSLVLWCGNNEVDEAWHNWGWQNQFKYSKIDSAEIWNNYILLFEEILPGLVEKYTPDIPYWASSPSTGWGRKAAYTTGDVHYWGVWWGKEPFENYNDKVGRFMSEYGFQGMPDMKTIVSFTEPGDRFLGSDVLDVHQKHPFGWEAIQEYMVRDYNVPESFEDYVFVSQLLQAKGIEMAIEAHRRAKPYCMGTLYWQFNDCWPVTSWSGIDYYGRWKALQYSVRRAFDTYLISFEEKNEKYAIHIISDSISDVEALLKWEIIDFSGKKLNMGNEEYTIKGNSSKIYAEIGMDQLTEKKSNLLISAELWSQDKLLCHAQHYFVRPKHLDLSPANIQMEVKEKYKKYLIELTSEMLVKDVCLISPVDGLFSDNYFDLLPGQTKSVCFNSFETKDQRPQFRIKCLNDIQ